MRTAIQRNARRARYAYRQNLNAAITKEKDDWVPAVWMTIPLNVCQKVRILKNYKDALIQLIIMLWRRLFKMDCIISEDVATRQFDCGSDDECFLYWKIQMNCCRYTGSLPGRRPNRCMVSCACPSDNSPNCHGEEVAPSTPDEGK